MSQITMCGDMTKRYVRIFPDYSATCFWEGKEAGGKNIEAEMSYILPSQFMISLKYWRAYWLRNEERMWNDLNADGYSEEVADWESDGHYLVEDMNEAQDEVEFIYVPSFILD